MQHVAKERLVQELLGMLQAGPSAPDAAGLAALRGQIEQAVARFHLSDKSVENRRVTILLSDLRGFTQVAEKYTAMEMVEALNRYFTRMNEIISRRGGTIDKFMGDAIMALFGLPEELPNDIEAALACAIEMQLAMREVNADNQALGMAPLYMGIGINTGMVVAGNLGSRLHSEYTVIGDQVNLASRVEAHTLRGQILLSENTYQLARGYITTGDINEVRVKGRKGTVRMYELLGISRPAPLLAPPREVRNSPRVQVDMALTFRLLRGKLVQSQPVTGRVVDISYGGMYILSPVGIEPFSDIQITLSLSMLGAQVTEIYAKVLRSAHVEDVFECRVEFTSIDATAALAIKEFVDGIVEMNQH